MQQPLTQRYDNIPLAPPTANPPIEPAPEEPATPSVLAQLKGFGQDEVRLANGIALVGIVLLAGVMNQFELPQSSPLALRSVAPPTPIVTTVEGEFRPPIIPQERLGSTTAAPRLPQATELSELGGNRLLRAAVPRTIIPERPRVEIRQYQIQAGDSVYGIAYKFGLQPETVLWSNPSLENNPHWLQVGQEVIILPTDGIYHQVGGSDTIASIASSYKVDEQTIIDYPTNELDLDNPIIQIGQWVVVPDGRKPFVPQVVNRIVSSYEGSTPADALVGLGIFGWPSSGYVSQGYYQYHPAVDIADYLGSPVSATDNGYVVAAGWDGPFGNMVVIDHGNSYQTLYAHLNSIYVSAGESVYQGQQIGEMGSTGNSTGPHLHFEIRQGSIQLNPLSFLR